MEPASDRRKSACTEERLIRDDQHTAAQLQQFPAARKAASLNDDVIGVVPRRNGDGHSDAPSFSSVSTV